jgi:hypothetical protein
MAGKQEGIEDVERTVLQDPRGKVKATLPEAQFQEVSARPTGKTSETGTSSVGGLETSLNNSRSGQR